MALSFHQSYITLGANRAAPPIPVPNAGPFRRRGPTAPAASHPLRHLSRASRPTGEGTAPGSRGSSRLCHWSINVTGNWLPSISAPAWFVSIGSVAGMPGVIARGSLKGYRELKADRRNRIQPGLCSPLAVHGASGLGGVGVLLEGRDLGVAQAPDVGELGVERSAGRLVSGLVVAERHDGVAGV